MKINKIYSDFDGTITKTDTVNTFFKKYADESWIKSEKLWLDGKISSRENAITQVGLLKPISERELNEFINSIEIDEYFLEFYKYLNKNNIELVILSDGFDLFIEKILERYNIQNVKYYANHLLYKNNKFSIEFPYYNDSCVNGSGMCKCAKINEASYIYIGDGNSDICVATRANLLFSKNYLNKYCNEKNIPHVSFENFNDILKCVCNN